MKIEEITLKSYLKFVKSVYENDFFFKDNKTELIKLVTKKTSPFAENSSQKMIAVRNSEGCIVCVSILIIHKNDPKHLYISFFEALENHVQSVNFLLQYSRNYAETNECTHIYLGIDGHVNHSFGFSTVEKSPSFGECYSPLYYLDYFRNQIDFTEIKAVSYHSTINHLKESTTFDVMRLKQKRKSEILIEKADFSLKGFKSTMQRFTELNNAFFEEQPFYYKRELEEDYQLFWAMYPLLSPENLLFAKYQGNDIGFFFWYPDFNEFVPVQKSASIQTFLKYKLLKQQPNMAKVVDMGVNRNYLSKLPILYLLHQGAHEVSDQSEKVEGSWILDSNEKSKLMTSRYMDEVGQEYVIFTCKL